MGRVLGLRTYRRLLVAYTLNELAWAIGTLALAVLVYRRTGSAVGATGFFLCSQFAPALLSPALVARLDQRAVRGVLASLYAFEAAAFGLLAWVASHFALAPMLVLVVADGLAAVSARAIARAATVQVTRPADLLREGNALTNTSFSICFMVGPAIGAVIVSLSSTTTALLVNSGLFAVITCVLATTTGLSGHPLAHDGRPRRLAAALAYAKGSRAVRSLLLVQAAAVLFFTISIPVEIVFVRHSLHGGSGAYGALLSAWGAGTVLGSAMFARWRALPPAILIATASAALGIGFALMAAAPSVWFAAAGAVLGGVGNGIEAVAARTALQEAVDASWMAMMMSLNELVFQAVPGAGIALGGAIAALAGPRPALAAGAAGALMIAVAAPLVVRPSVPAMVRQSAHQAAADGDSARAQ